MIYDVLLFSFYSFIATLAFSVIFNIKGRNLFFAAIGGGISWFFYLISIHSNMSNTLSIFNGALSTAIYSEITARALKAPVTTFIISGILPLVPGGGMYYTMLEFTRGDVNKALEMGLNTLTTAGAIAIALVLVSSITKLIKYKKRKIKK
ncbi:threonine/serine exporter family protein [uncultured Clostridium sp.]|uniref:threonine/serine exporter family protein n=1 Tax=uncultured Clostridium sp. TaxID=59620 RepID=UPI0028ED38A9|nr:threonine/serine exporter family protein [uncultured Clostridium sp.]